MVHVVEIDGDNVSKLLEPYAQSGNLNFLIGSGASAPAIPPLGNIEGEINKLVTDGKDAEADKKCFEFIQQINAVHTKMVADKDATVKKVTNGYINLLSAIDTILFARKSTLLARQANIFTTNYDLFVEHAANLVPSVILNDGFDRTASLKPDFTFAPERFFDRTYRSGLGFGHPIEIPTINLIKIHGSLSWRRRTRTIAFDSTPAKDLTEEEKQNPAKIKEFLETHFLVLPNLKKFHSTLIDRVYYDLLRLYSKAMDQQNVVLLSFGFSFEDEHLLDITKRALRNPTAQLIIFSYDTDSVEGYKSKFVQQRNVAVISPEPGATIDIERLNTILFPVSSGQDDVAA